MEHSEGGAPHVETERRGPRRCFYQSTSSGDSNLDPPEAAADIPFTGIGGATSLKAEISQRVPNLNDAKAYRQARELLLGLGGAMALRAELGFSGFVDTNTNLLTTNLKPFNEVARLAVGKMKQPQHGMEREQAALGPYRDRFKVCCNEPQMDLHWNSADPYHRSKASMSQRHRYITTRDLHWQWFNALIFGLVPNEVGGASAQEALEEVEALRDAALHYAKTVGGWSDNIGLFVHVFGHNTMNALSLHVVDMSMLGPSFHTNQYRNCPLEAVLEVLREDTEGLSPYELTEQPFPLPHELSSPRRRKWSEGGSSVEPLFFSGTEGATSLKDELAARVPVLRDAARFREVRRVLLQELGGIASLYEELLRFNIIEHSTGNLSTGTAPMNLFARIVVGKTRQPQMDLEQEWLGPWQDHYQICCNRTDYDDHWDSEDPEWVGRASMAKRHRFLTTKRLHWQWFNALSFGLVPPEDGGVSLEESIAELQDMKAAALYYTSNAPGWSSNVGLFFHVFGHNSVNSLHLHVLDMDHVGPTFRKLNYKNCPLDAVLKILDEERVQSATSRADNLREGDGSDQILVTRFPSLGEYVQVVCGGEEAVQVFQVPVETLSIAPDGSRLKDMLTPSCGTERLRMDAEGRYMLDAHPECFRLILNQMTLVRGTNDQEVVRPLTVPEELRPDVEGLAIHLGVGFILEQPLYGRLSMPFIRTKSDTFSEISSLEFTPHTSMTTRRSGDASDLSGCGGQCPSP